MGLSTFMTSAKLRNAANMIEARAEIRSEAIMVANLREDAQHLERIERLLSEGRDGEALDVLRDWLPWGHA